MHVVVIVERLEKFADLLPLHVGKFRAILRQMAEFARHHRPAILRKPLRHRARRRAIGDETRALAIRRDVVVLLVRERLDFIRASLDGRLLDVTSSLPVCASTRPTCSNRNLLLPGVPSWPFLKSTRMSGAVRLLLSVSASTITATLCGA